MARVLLLYMDIFPSMLLRLTYFLISMQMYVILPFNILYPCMPLYILSLLQSVSHTGSALTLK